MVVEPESFCWSSGRLVDQRDGRTWAGELSGYSSLEYVVRDGGTGLSKGISLIQAERPELRDGLDVFHTLREGAKALRKTWSAASRALEAADAQQKRFDRLGRQGKSRQGKGGPLKQAWAKAEQRMDQADRAERAFGQIKQALALFTPGGEANDRTRAERIVREQLPYLVGPQWDKTVRLLRRRETFTFLDRLHEALGRLVIDPDELDAALRFEGLRRCRGLWRDETPQAAAAGALVLVETVRLQKDGRWREVVAQVPRTLRGCGGGGWFSPGFFDAEAAGDAKGGGVASCRGGIGGGGCACIISNWMLGIARWIGWWRPRSRSRCGCTSGCGICSACGRTWFCTT